MLDWIKSLFGKGRLRIEFEGVDQAGKLVSGNAKMPYIGKFTEEDAIAEFKEQCMYKHGVRVTRAAIVAHIGD
jgi:hypothetical protein